METQTDWCLGFCREMRQQIGVALMTWVFVRVIVATGRDDQKVEFLR